MKKFVTAILAFFFTAACACAGSPVWQVSDGANTLYIGGTIHVLAEKDYPLPQVFDEAYQASQRLVFETDIARTQDPEFAKQMMNQMVYSNGRSLQTIIRPSTFNTLAKFSSDRGIPVQNLAVFKPGMVMVFLTLAEMERIGAGGAGVDEFFFQKAMADNRPMQFLEAPMDQILFLADIGAGKEDEMITYILKDIGKLTDLLPTIKKAWRTGDNDLLYKETLAPLKKEYPALYDTIMVKRNLAWLPAIQKMLATRQTEFILVGAAHLAGDQGLLSLLKKEGYKVVNK